MPSHKRISKKRAKKRRIGSFYRPTKTTIRTGACSPNKILRKAYTRRDGTRVQAVCVKNKGLPGKTIASAKVLPKLKVGKLTRYGYHADLSAKMRLVALSKSVRDVGYATTIRRVVAIRNYSEHNPRLLKIYETDIKNLQKKYRSKRSKFRANSKRRSPRKSSRRRRKSSRRCRKSSKRRRKSSKRRRKSSRRRPRKSSRRRRKNKLKFFGGARKWLQKRKKSRSRRRQIAEFRKSSDRLRRRIKKSGPKWSRDHRRKRKIQRQRRMDIPYVQARKEARRYQLELARRRRLEDLRIADLELAREIARRDIQMQRPSIKRCKELLAMGVIDSTNWRRCVRGEDFRRS